MKLYLTEANDVREIAEKIVNTGIFDHLNKDILDQYFVFMRSSSADEEKTRNVKYEVKARVASDFWKEYYKYVTARDEEKITIEVAAETYDILSAEDKEEQILRVLIGIKCDDDLDVDLNSIRPFDEYNDFYITRDKYLKQLAKIQGQTKTEPEAKDG